MRAGAVPLEAVPDALFDGPFQLPFQSGRAWWRCVTQAAMPAGIPRFLLAGQPGEAAGLLPLAVGRGWGRGVAGLVTPYTCLFQPLLAPGTDPVAVGEAWGRNCGATVLRLDALDPDWPAWPGLLAGFARAGFGAAWFDSFGNWHQHAGDWQSYLAQRPGALRETIRRRLGRAERDPSMVFTLARDPPAVAAALDAYEAVHARSWKQPEPHPRFGAAFTAAAAAAGVLRFGVLARDGVPLAAQYWTVEPAPGVAAGVAAPGATASGGVTATVLKLAHDEAARAHSPGTVLTAWMIRGLLAEGVTALDFGRGDDPYKRDWVAMRRQRRGLVLGRVWHPAGAAALLRQHAGGWRRRLGSPSLPGR